MTGVAAALAQRTLELVDIPSVSRDEARLADHVRDVMPRDLRLLYDADSTLFYATPRTGRPFVVLAGHLDTVPAQDNIPGRIDDGYVVGLGSSDMKGGDAVMIELARALPEERAVDVGFLFFPREELPADESALPAAFEGAPELLETDLAIMLEPTDCEIHAGCLGNVNARLTFAGVSGHSARPWLADNAIARAVEGLRDVVALDPLDVETGGLVFREVLSVTRIAGGIADNVIPDRVEAHLNFRYAPTRTPAEAEARLRELVDGRGTLEITGNSAPARVAVDNPLVQRLRDVDGLPVRPKQAWTPVAEFSAAGLDAINFGPGAPAYAHRRDERVAIALLARAYTALWRFISGE